jgi:hypothetical protein
VSAAYMGHRARDLAWHTQIRIASDYAILVLGSLFMAWCSWRYLLHRPVIVAGIILTVLAAAYVAFRKHRLAPAAHVPEDAGALDSLGFWQKARMAKWGEDFGLSLLLDEWCSGTTISKRDSTALHI